MSSPHKMNTTTPALISACGGLLMALSMFFRLSYGPWGAELSFYGLISHNFNWGGWPVLLLAWPVVFGMLETVFAFASVFKKTRSIEPWHALTLGIFLGVIAGLHFVAVGVHGGLANFQRSEALIALVPAALVLVGILLVSALTRPVSRSTQWVRLIGAAWVLVRMFPTPSDWVPLESIFLAYGMGLWMLLGGALLVLAASLYQLVHFAHTRESEPPTQPGGSVASRSPLS